MGTPHKYNNYKNQRPR